VAVPIAPVAVCLLSGGGGAPDAAGSLSAMIMTLVFASHNSARLEAGRLALAHDGWAAASTIAGD
jgi:hypothetical protein